MRLPATMALLLLTAACGSPEQQADESDALIVPAAIAYDGAAATGPAAKLAHGERIARILGCIGCHGENLQGRNVTADDPGLGDMNAPNITLLLPKYTDAELDRLIRHGVPKDGRELWWMPPENYQYLSDADFAALIGYLRTVKPAGTQLPPIRKGPDFLKLVEAGELEPAGALVARFRKEQPVDLGSRHALGRYLAMTTCTECHNSQLQGYKDFSPDLVVAGAYSRDEFERLITQGIPAGQRKLKNELMTLVAKDRFAKMTRHERDALYAYLKARAEQPQ